MQADAALVSYALRPIDDAFGSARPFVAVVTRHGAAPRGDVAHDDDAVDVALGLAVEAARECHSSRRPTLTPHARGAAARPRRPSHSCPPSVAVSAIERFYLWRVLAPGRFAPRPRAATRPQAAASCCSTVACSLGARAAQLSD